MRNHRLAATGLVLAALLAGSGPAAAQSRSDIHRDAATRNVGDDPFMMRFARAFYCNLADNNNQIVIESRGWNNQTGTGDNAQYRIPATQIFDDVWFVGNHYVGQYLIKTPAGLVQVDAANSAAEVALFNVPAMQALGLGPTYPLRAVLLTHGHRDHDGGAQYLRDNLGAEIFLGSADAAGKAYAPTAIDSNDLSMRAMSIGGKKFWILPTPGHTQGSTSAVVEVMDHGRPVRVLINGGQSMTNSIPQVAQYLDSIERTYVMAKALRVDGVMTPHIYWDGEGEKMREILASGRTRPSQHVYGNESVVRQLVVARECSAAWLSRLDATVVLPVWRYNRIELLDGARGPNRVAARLYNGWGPLANMTVRFSAGKRGDSCSATTDANGVASCRMHRLRPHKDRVTAAFSGAEGGGFIELPAQVTARVCGHHHCKDKKHGDREHDDDDRHDKDDD
jgi:glyoxylase-like metal-dependent hydrolase (beta-lactamase superfamily II)